MTPTVVSMALLGQIQALIAYYSQNGRNTAVHAVSSFLLMVVIICSSQYILDRACSQDVASEHTLLHVIDRVAAVQSV